MTDILPFIELPPAISPKKTVIWLHGLGADGSDFTPIIPELRLPKELGIRFIFPHAPIMPVTVNNGYEMPAWYDIYSLTSGEKLDKAGIQKSVAAINQLIAQEEQRGINNQDIMLAGFSQGAVIALITGLLYPKKLAGIIALSGYFPLAEETLQQASSSNKTIPIFLAHGTEDSVVPYILSNMTDSVLRKAGYNVTCHNYPMAHSVSPQEINDISRWIQKVWG